jgi:hypothetical protein
VISSIFLSRGEDFEVTWTVEGEDKFDSTNDVSRKYIRTLITRDYFGLMVSFFKPIERITPNCKKNRI